jgi:hypothetical protein
MFDFIKKMFGQKVSDMVNENTESVSNILEKVEEKAESVLGEEGRDMVDSAVNKAEDTIEKTTGIDVDLNKDNQ